MDKFYFTAADGNAPKPVRALLSELTTLALEVEPRDDSAVDAFVKQLHQHPHYQELGHAQYMAELKSDLRSAAYYWEEAWRFKQGWPAIKRAVFGSSAEATAHEENERLAELAMSMDVTHSLWTDKAKQAWSVIDTSLNVASGDFYHVSVSEYFPPLDLLNEFLLAGCDTDEGGSPRGHSWQPFSVTREEYLVVLRSWITEVADCQVNDLGEQQWYSWLAELTDL